MTTTGDSVWDSGEVVIPTVSFSLAAIVRRKESGDREHEQEYVLVHEKPPRGWWLPGGGIEHHDETPVDAAIRETVEEAGSPSLLPLLSSPQSIADESKVVLLPTMTHLISLEQSPGRLRFIFRGEWVDNSIDSCDNRTDSARNQKSILKCHRDEESIEAKWVTWDEVQCFEEIKRGARVRIELPQKEMTAASQAKIQSMNDPWLRGHEPLTFYQILETSWQQKKSVPGLPVHRMHLSSGQQDQTEDIDTGAFFGRIHDEQSKKSLNHGRRAALLTHLKCHLLIYDKSKKTIAVDATTKRLPSSIVNDQNEMTLKQLVDEMIANLNGESQDLHHYGLLRVEYIIHGNGREADLTVFPLVCISSTDGAYLSKRTNEFMAWVAAADLIDNLERKLAEAVISDDGTHPPLNILRDREGPLHLADD